LLTAVLGIHSRATTSTAAERCLDVSTTKLEGLHPMIILGMVPAGNSPPGTFHNRFLVLWDSVDKK